MHFIVYVAAYVTMVGAVGTRETRSNHTRVTAWLHEMTEVRWTVEGRGPSPEAHAWALGAGGSMDSFI